MTVIDIKNISKTFSGKRGKKVKALQDLSLSIKSGEVFGFLGPNGAGKSTTIKILMGMVQPSVGECKINGVLSTSPAARVKVGYLPENPSFYDFLTAKEYLQFIGRVFKMESSQLEKESERVLDLMDLKQHLDRPIKGFSKGMVQRLGLAQCLLHNPDIYILDEPMSGLDPIGRALVKDIIKDLKSKGKTVFFSTHITSDIEIVCDRVAIIFEGKLQSIDAVNILMQKGIEGYSVRLRNIPEALLQGFEYVKNNDEVIEVYLPSERYKEFMALFVTTDGEIDLIEPKRKNLEDFFLDTIAKINK
jgi:ABC-2 type transport system ATP-binding protein